MDAATGGHIVTPRHRFGTQHARTVVIGLLVLVVAYLLVSQVRTQVDANDAQGRASNAQAKADAVADPVDALCARGDEVARALAARGACTAAKDVKDAPREPAPVPGAKGDTGVGIARAEAGDCAVTVVLDDGRRFTVRDLCGEPGKPGEPGRGIASTVLDGCYVTVNYSDNSPPTRLGPLCGPPGEPGATGAKGDKGDPGESPPCLAEPTQCRGPAGAKGDKGDKGDPAPPAEEYRWTNQDGKPQSCHRDKGSPDGAPTYTCTAPPPGYAYTTTPPASSPLLNPPR